MSCRDFENPISRYSGFLKAPNSLRPPEDPSETDNETILARLLALNLERTGQAG
jgi:hypothetical protein